MVYEKGKRNQYIFKSFSLNVVNWEKLLTVKTYIVLDTPDSLFLDRLYRYRTVRVRQPSINHRGKKMQRCCSTNKKTPVCQKKRPTVDKFYVPEASITHLPARGRFLICSVYRAVKYWAGDKVKWGRGWRCKLYFIARILLYRLSSSYSLHTYTQSVLPGPEIFFQPLNEKSSAKSATFDEILP